MYIKEISITGFRSYREETKTSDLSPKHNVVVGRNGSGKSNFFAAIQFVLSNEYSHLSADQRNNILHEGTGKVSQAKVEIVFDNSDHRLLQDSPEVRISRQVGQKKDQYFIDSRVVTRTDIVNLMESAGFSRSNPYYIVKQGKITELATSSDAYRLKLIKEVAGTRVFDEKKEESTKILIDTQGKIAKSETLLSFIEDRLKKLEEEKEDLKEYQNWDKMKRAIEYTIYELEIEEARKKCEKLARERERINHDQNGVENELLETKASLQSTETQIRKLENRFKGMRDERSALLGEQTKYQEKKNEVDLSVKDLQEDVERERALKSEARTQLGQIKEQISTKQQQLEEVEPKYAKLRDDESRLATDIRIDEQHCKELYAKQGYSAQFSSAAERDQHLKKEIRFIEQQIRENEDQKKEIEDSLAEDRGDAEKLDAEKHALAQQLNTTYGRMESKNAELAAKKMELERAVNDKTESWRTEKQHRDLLDSFTFDIGAAEQELRRITPRGIMNGNQSIRSILSQLRDNNADGRHDEILNGYHGCIIDLFECDERYNKAIEVIAEGRLFYHVVDNDKIAMKLLKMMNERDLKGEANFFPINRMTAKEKRGVSDKDAKPMLEEMRYDPNFDVIFRSIFVNTVFVRDLKTGQRVARAERFDCVTLEGDVVSRRGPMTGGYMDVKKSKIGLARTIRNYCNERDAARARIDGLSQAGGELNSQIEKIRLQIDKINSELMSLSYEHRNTMEKQRSISEQLNRLFASKEPKNSQLLIIRERIRELEAHRDMLNEQLATDLESSLSSTERKSLEEFEKSISQKKQALEKLSKERQLAENEKSSLEIQLQSNLLKRREGLTARINDITAEEKQNKLNSQMMELKSTNARLSQLISRLTDLDENLTEYDTERDELGQTLESCQEKKRQLDSKMDEFAKHADVFCTKMAGIQAKREDCLRKIQEIGSLPRDALGKYENMSLKQLDRKLTECMGQLKKYENVNKKALDQFVRASGQKEELSNRVVELKRNEDSIRDLLGVLDNRRYETLQLTFKQVAKNFREVFGKLIPNGNGNLVMKTEDQQAIEEAKRQNPNLHVMETFIGVGITVSFTGGEGTREMSHLSGGQKSLVALALIFAIQKCDPAPFYLFDEIDAALDQEHRRSVAEMIHELSDSAQFITTTFRAELLEHAEKYFGVVFRNKISYIDEVSREKAYDFIQDDQTHS